MKIKLTCGEVTIKPLPVYADKAVDLLNYIQGMGARDDAFSSQRDLLVDILSYAEPKTLPDQLVLGDILFMMERFGEIVAVAFAMPKADLVSRVTQPGDEVVEGEAAFNALKAAGMVTDATGKAEGKS